MKLKAKKCMVFHCKRDADTTWWTEMCGGHDIPVCAHHYGRRLWWYRGVIFCRDEEGA